MAKLRHYYPFTTITTRCSYTYRNIARTAIEVSDARRMARQHSHLRPVLFQCPQLASSSKKNQQQFNLYQSPRTCRGKSKWLPFNNIIVDRTFMIQISNSGTSKCINSSFSVSNLDPYRVRPSDHVPLKDDIGHETSDPPSNDAHVGSVVSVHTSPEISLTRFSYKSCSKNNADFSTDFQVQ